MTSQTIALRSAAPNPATVRGSSLSGGPMRLAELVYGPWAMLPEHLLELQAIYETHLRGDKIDIKAVEARLGRPLANEPRGYEVVNGVAVLPVQGAIAPKANLMTQVSGGASAQLLAREMLAAGADHGVRSVILAVDSPGGSVLGTPELAAAVRQVAAVKPVVTHCDGMLASAAYWVGSAANAVHISGPTVLVGSIGVVATHRDTSAAEARMGVTTTEITAGKYKRIASASQPLSAEGRASLQAQVDYLYELFVDAVSAQRGASVDVVLEHMADGRVFTGQQAIDAGLVDGVSTLDALIEAMATNPAAYAARRQAAVKATGSGRRTARPTASAGAALASPVPTPPSGAVMAEADQTNTLTREALERDHPALFAQLATEFTAAGAAAELGRVQAVRAAALPGHEALVEQLAADGSTSGAQAALQVLAAERGARSAAAAAHAADAPPAAPGALGGGSDGAAKSKTQMAAEAQAYAAEHGCDFMAAFKKLGFDR